MANNRINNDIDPRLEQILKEELTNRAKKMEAMKQWQQTSGKKDADKSHLKILYGAISGIAAMLLVGVFILHDGGILGEDPSMAGEPIYRGVMVDPSIYDALEAGDTLQAIHLIDSSRQECSSRLQQLDNIEITDENRSEAEEMRQQLELELEELKKVEQSIAK